MCFRALVHSSRKQAGGAWAGELSLLFVTALARAAFGHTGVFFEIESTTADMLHQNRRGTVGRSINMFDFVLKGANASQLEKDIGSDLFPANEHFFGLVNVSHVHFYVFTL